MQKAKCPWAWDIQSTYTLFVRFLLVVDYSLLLCRVACWTTAGKKLTSWLSDCEVLLHAVWNMFLPFPYGVCGRMWNSIVVSVPDQSLFIYNVLCFLHGVDSWSVCLSSHCERLLLRTLPAGGRACVRACVRAYVCVCGGAMPKSFTLRLYYYLVNVTG